MSDFLLDRCLLIDDTMVDRYVHTKLLSHHKIARNIDECSGGKEALIYLEEAIVSDTLPDLILLDLMMPEMDGFELIRPYSNIISKLVKKPLLYMLSSTEDERDIHRAKVNNHIIKLLRKPLRPEYLMTLIKIQI